MAESKNYSYLVYTDINRAMRQYNHVIIGSKLNIMDANILSIVKSFSEAGYNFFMSNRELADITISDASTVQKSINRLISIGLLKKEVVYDGQRPRRILIYQKDVVNNFLSSY